MVARARRPPRRRSSSAAVSASRAPLAAQRVPQRDGPTVRVDVVGVHGQPQLAQHRHRLRGERLVQLHHVHSAQLDADAVEQLAGGRHRADPHDPGRHAGRRRTDDPGQRGQTVPGNRRLAGHQQRDRAVVDARRVTGGDSAAVAERGGQRGQLLQRRLPGVLVDLDQPGLPPTGRHGHRHDLLGEPAVGLRLGRTLLRAVREGVLLGPADAVLDGHVLRRLRHRVDPPPVAHQRVHQPPAQGGVVHLRRAGVRRRPPSA